MCPISTTLLQLHAWGDYSGRFRISFLATPGRPRSLSARRSAPSRSVVAASVGRLLFLFLRVLLRIPIVRPLFLPLWDIKGDQPGET